MPHVPLHVSDKFKGKSKRGLYGDVIMEIDWSVGQILAALKDQAIDERTLVIFTSDNGPWLCYGDHAGSAGPLREGKRTTWEGGLREPCIMRWPGKIPADTVCREPSMTIDILPTVAKLADAELPSTRSMDWTSGRCCPASRMPRTRTMPTTSTWIGSCKPFAAAGGNAISPTPTTLSATNLAGNAASALLTTNPGRGLPWTIWTTTSAKPRTSPVCIQMSWNGSRNLPTRPARIFGHQAKRQWGRPPGWLRKEQPRHVRISVQKASPRAPRG